ncbi:MAG TPA: efflux RND transporter permease subunit, partial [Planctomycetaceae bacterium]|nr:efflux RND transporter permease subunit [Planctomycetaceae bacterium]
RVQLGAKNEDVSSRVDGHPISNLAIFQLPDANALATADVVKAKIEELKKEFPPGVDYMIRYDTTPFIRESVHDVVKTLLEAIVLVGIVVLAFLQSWRATLIPLIAVPVAIVGTFAVMAVLGFSLNNISLFGLVLAIGIVVDDAIVVVENVERWLEQGLEPREAARRAMDEVTAPVIAVALVLCTVFLPCTFITGITGEFFRQFAVTISVSTVFSALNSLTLSPALAAIILKPHGTRPDVVTRLMNATLGWFFRLFNAVFRVGTDIYARGVGLALRLCLLSLVLYAGLLGVTWWLFGRYPVGFIPQQDQGWVLLNAQLPDSASVQRTSEVMAKVEQIARATPGVAHTVSVSGQSILMSTNSSNFGSMFVILEPFEHRQSPDRTANAIMARLRKETAEKIREATIGVFGAPPVPGIGLASGFKLLVEDRGSLGLDTLQKATDDLVADSAKLPHMVVVPTMFRANTPQLYMDIDRTKTESLGASVADVNQMLQVFLGSYYVNNFNEFGRFWQVNLQAAGEFRNRIGPLNQFYVRNEQHEMIPLGTLVQMRDVGGPVMIMRYNLYSAAPVMGGGLPPLSSGQTIKIMEREAEKVLPQSMQTEWTELTFMQIRAGDTATLVFGAAVVFVFLVLAAQYESWTLPLAVILVVPMCLLCSLLGVLLRRLPMDIFVQIGFVVLVGLACKNAILIVEFAKQLRSEGKPLGDATIDACRLRLRPILMTSFAFILGVVPMVVARGAGAEMRWSLGTAVFSGMLGVTLFGVMLTPVFFYVIEWVGETHLFQFVWFQRVGSVLLGGAAGLTAGYLVSKTGFPTLRWALVCGFLLGLVAATIVQFGLRTARAKVEGRLPVHPPEAGEHRT